jgi:hypothetical protein
VVIWGWKFTGKRVLAQNDVIRLANIVGKPIITATQMLGIDDCESNDSQKVYGCSHAVLDGTGMR